LPQTYRFVLCRWLSAWRCRRRLRSFNI
jgi:hypothetical protein